MKLPNEKIELVASTEPSRYALQSLKYEPENKRLVATNGVSIAMIPVTAEEGDTGGLIPREALIQARKLRKASPSIKVNCEQVHVTTAGVSLSFIKQDGHYPNYEGAIPKAEPKVVIALDVKLLYELAQALREPTYNGRLPVQLHITDNSTAIVVKPIGADTEAKGAIMPCRL